MNPTDAFRLENEAGELNAYLGARDYGPSIAPGAAPRPSLGPASPYLPSFMHFIGVELMKNAPLRAPVPSLVPRSWPPPPLAPKRSNAGRIALSVLGFLLLVGAAAAMYFLRAAHH